MPAPPSATAPPPPGYTACCCPSTGGLSWRADRQKALDLLSGALETAEQLGMSRLAEQARSVRDHGVQRVREGAPSGRDAPLPGRRGAAGYPAGLTAREVEVLRLIAAGNTNR